MPPDKQDLRKAGLKVTHPRIIILQILESADQRHLSADDIYHLLHERGEEVGIATVYRVLTQFENAGLVLRHSFDNGPALYEINQGDHHDHMVCVESGDVFEFRDDKIESIQKKIAADRGYEIIGHSLVLYVKPVKK